LNAQTSPGTLTAVMQETPLTLSLAIAEAVFDGAPLRPALARIAAAVRGDEVTIVCLDHWTGQREVHAARTSDEVLATYWRSFASHNPREAVWRDAPPGIPVDFDRHVCPRALASGPLGPLMRRSGFPARHVCGVRMPAGGDAEIRLAVGRNAGGGFEPRTLALIGALAPHVASAFRARRLLAPPGAVPAPLPGQAAIEALPAPIALVESRGRCVLANAALRVLLARGDGLRIGETRLMATDAEADRALAEAAHRLLDPAAPPSVRMGAILVPRTGSARPYVVRAIALGEASPLARGIAFVVTAPDAAAPAPEILRSLLGLTQAEAELAALLGGGATLAEAARARRISVETARSQLKAVLGKTGCARQQDLARLLARLGGADATA